MKRTVRTGLIGCGFALSALGACDAGRNDTQSAGPETASAHADEASAALGESARVASAAPAAGESMALGARVKSAVGVRPGLRALSVDADPGTGAVTLYGTASTAALRDLVGQIALGVDGVTTVTNHIFLLKET